MIAAVAYQPLITEGWQLMVLLALGFVVVALLFSYAKRKAARDTKSDTRN